MLESGPRDCGLHESEGNVPYYLTTGPEGRELLAVSLKLAQAELTAELYSRDDSHPEIEVRECADAPLVAYLSKYLCTFRHGKRVTRHA